MIKPSEWLSTLNKLLVNSRSSFLVNIECRAGCCVGCLNPVARNGLCQGCYTDLPWNRWHCRCCALPLPFPASDHLCGECLQRPPAFDLTLAPLRYQFPVAAMIGRYKYQGQRAYARPLTAALAELAHESLLRQPQLRPDVLIPAPMHPQRRRQRGHDIDEIALQRRPVGAFGFTFVVAFEFPGTLKRPHSNPPSVPRRWRTKASCHGALPSWGSGDYPS